MRMLRALAAVALLLLQLDVIPAFILQSSDVGIHKCEFKGTLGEQRVTLYVFLTSCVRPTSTPSPPSPSSPSANDTQRDAPFDEWADPRGGPLPNFYLSGFAFMSAQDPDAPVLSTQLQQPLSTLLWAAQGPFLDTMNRLGNEEGKWGPGKSRGGGGGGGGGDGASADGGGRRRQVMQWRSDFGEGGQAAAADGSDGGGGRAAGGGRSSGAGAGGGGGGGRAAGQGLEDPNSLHTFYSALLAAARQLHNGSLSALSIRSGRSGSEWPIHLSLHDPHHWHHNPSLGREPARLAARLALPAEEWAAVAGGSGDGLKPGAAAFEVRAGGLEGVCQWNPDRGRRRLGPSSPGSSGSPAAGSAAAEGSGRDGSASGGAAPSGGGGGGGGGAPTCAWLDPGRMLHDGKILATWKRMHKPSGTSGSSRRRRRRKRGPKMLPPPPSPPAPPPAAAAAPTYMVVSPFFNLQPYDFVTLLVHHVTYHRAVGIRRYLVYVEEGEEGLAADPRLAALAAEGAVEVVRWLELPPFRLPHTPGRHPYASQILAYNHALLALWSEGALVAVADLDEYLMASQQNPLEQLMLACGPHGKHPPGALWVPRRAALCSACWAGALPQPVPTGGPQPLARALEALAAEHLRNDSLAAAAASQERRLWLYDPSAPPANTTNAAAGEGDNRSSASDGTGAAGGGAGGAAGRGGGAGAGLKPGQGTALLGPGLAAGPGTHPLELYRHWHEGWHHKSIFYVHHLSYFGVHLAYSTSVRHPHTIARVGCAVWAHLETQLGPRAKAPLLALEGKDGGKGKGEGHSRNKDTDLYYQLTDPSVTDDPARPEPPIRSKLKEVRVLHRVPDLSLLTARQSGWNKYLTELRHPCAGEVELPSRLRACLATAPSQQLTIDGLWADLPLNELWDAFSTSVQHNPETQATLLRLRGCGNDTACQEEGWRDLVAAGYLGSLGLQLFSTALYRYTLAAWRRHFFQPNRVMVIDSHAYYADRPGVMEKVIRFLYGRNMTSAERSLAAQGQVRAAQNRTEAPGSAPPLWRLSEDREVQVRQFFKEHVMEGLYETLRELGEEEGAWVVGFDKAPWPWAA
ncbi:hypothetical protein HYH03_004983 [Edaphochlamys debaryana]|uniref:Glycosyltransferase family 92 protein n=1 Tax=Edaphochlamys debaryana TaxID=47281 RepID=A0A836C2M9_9CHLO|nr:hypothetical protein HYH03_004983 [Edaphochlamys debaryana]|eukprot:KAG2496977.1 hypothetical protein HYH03_004983 [Edaphochlamys debaryana]